MTRRPSTKFALYFASVLIAYLIPNPVAAITYAIIVIGLGLVAAIARGRPIPPRRWRGVLVFVAWVLLMRVALDVVGGAHLRDASVWLLAGRYAARVAVLAIGVLYLVSLIAPREIVDELETSRLPGSLRLLVMMLVQYPRVLRDRFDQIVEAQVARGADRPRSTIQRAAHGGRILLPVMQSELNAVGERSALLHLRKLDADVVPSSPVIPSSARDDRVTFEGYSFKYAVSERPSLESVSLSIPAGRVTSVIAPQGMGKTTLLRAVSGLLGAVYHGESQGSIIGPLDPPAGAFFDGYVQVTLTVETVREEIGLPLIASGVPPAERDQRVAAVARELAMTNLLDRGVTALSGGEEKLVGIAAALVADAKVFVLDEPFEQLDVHHFTAVIQAAKRRARAGAIVLIATGSIDTAINIADAAVVGNVIPSIANDPSPSRFAPSGQALARDEIRWRYEEHPSYASAGVAATAVSEFARRPLSEIHRFREAVA
jgi:energy-coupling factor transporter ATP-binding protein EcfA2/energy-coupling factor transporter transmembrane protein EcfT